MRKVNIKNKVYCTKVKEGRAVLPRSIEDMTTYLSARAWIWNDHLRMVSNMSWSRFFQITRKDLDRFNMLTIRYSCNFCRLLDKDVVMCCFRRTACVSPCAHTRTEWNDIHAEALYIAIAWYDIIKNVSQHFYCYM